MAAVSSLFRFQSFNKNIIFSLHPLKNKMAPIPHQIIRFSSNKRTMQIIPSNYEWTKYKDHFHFYILLGAIPLSLIVLATNLFIGPAELADIPEGYEPKHWEYYRSPITQFLARYFIVSPQKNYERHLHFVAIEDEKIMMRKLEKKIALLLDAPSLEMYRKWYYVPYDDKLTHFVNKEIEGMEDDDTFSR